MTKNIFVLLILSIVLFSCEKENDTKMQDNLQNQKTQVLEEMSELEADINDFLQKIDDEEEGILPLDSAVYYLEAGFNYRYAQYGNDRELGKKMLDTSVVDITILEEDFCQYQDLNTAFADIYTRMSGVFQEIDDNDKALHIVDVKLVEVENVRKLRLISSWKYSHTGFLDFFEGDWSWGFNDGRCDHSDRPFDAKDAIMFKYDLSHVLPYGIWTNINSRTALWAYDFPLPSGQHNPFGFADCYLYADGNDCLLEHEIDYYAHMLTYAADIAKNISTYDPPTNQLVKEAILLDPHATGKGLWHRLKLIVGDFHEQRIMTPNQDFFQI